jgi:hypothetical protein
VSCGNLKTVRNRQAFVRLFLFGLVPSRGRCCRGSHPLPPSPSWPCQSHDTHTHTHTHIANQRVRPALPCPTVPFAPALRPCLLRHAPLLAIRRHRQRTRRALLFSLRPRSPARLRALRACAWARVRAFLPPVLQCACLGPTEMPVGALFCGIRMLKHVSSCSCVFPVCFPSGLP